MKPNISKIRLSIALASVLAVPSAHAGTYSVIGVEWYPSPGVGTDGGSINFGSASLGQNPLDLHYSLVRSISALADGNNTYAAPMVEGMWRWKVAWVGEPGENAPLTVQATVQAKGEVGVGTFASSSGWTGTALASTSDPFLVAISGATDDGLNSVPFVEHSDSDSGSFTRPVGASGFTHISGTTYHGYVTCDVMSAAALEVHGGKEQVGTRWFARAHATATIDLSMALRLTHVAGQRVQPDL